MPSLNDNPGSIWFHNDHGQAFIVQFYAHSITMEVGQPARWIGLLHYEYDTYFGTDLPHPREFKIECSDSWVQDVGFMQVFDDVDMGNTVLVNPKTRSTQDGRIRFFLDFSPQDTGDRIIEFTIKSNSWESAIWAWVEPSTFLIPRTDHFGTGYQDPRALPIIVGPENIGPNGVMVIDSPIIHAERHVRASSKIAVYHDHVREASSRVMVRNVFAAADTKVSVGSKRRISCDTRIRCGFQVGVFAGNEVTVHQDRVISADTSLHVINHVIHSGSAIRVHKPFKARAKLKVGVSRPTMQTSSVSVFVGFIDLETLKRDMQIQVGADTDIDKETFSTVPVINGVEFFKNLKHILIMPGSESVKRVALNESASGLYGIDYVQGRFVWFGSTTENIEITYRYSLSMITDENLSAAMIKTTMFLKEILRPDADLSDTRFIRGGTELAMSFLMDSAIWAAMNTISNFQGESGRIDALVELRQNVLRRAYETLGPFIQNFFPGSPTSMKIIPSVSILPYSGGT